MSNDTSMDAFFFFKILEFFNFLSSKFDFLNKWLPGIRDPKQVLYLAKVAFTLVQYLSRVTFVRCNTYKNTL
jgi:hypothetical protein